MINVFDNFNQKVRKPLENNHVCNELSDIKLPYDGLITFQKSDRKFYKYLNGKFKETLTNDLIINIKDFGGIGDGVVDDTNAIQTAINSLPNGGAIFFPMGVYKISDTITIGDGTKDSISSSNCIRLIGENNAPTNLSVWAINKGTRISYDGALGKPMIRILGPILSPSIEGLSLLCNSKASHGIHLTCVGQGKFDKLTITDATDYGIYADIWDNLTVSGTANNIQCEFSNIFINEAFNDNAVCFRVKGYSTTPAVDTNMCVFRNMFLLYSGNGGSALHLGFIDASMFQSIHCYRNGTINGSYSIIFDGSDISGYPNEIGFYNISTTNDGYNIIGTIGNINFIELMTGDGGVVPNHPKISGITSHGEIFGNYFFSNDPIIQNSTPCLQLVNNNINSQTRILKNATSDGDFGTVIEDTTGGVLGTLRFQKNILAYNGYTIIDSDNPHHTPWQSLTLSNGWTGSLQYAKDYAGNLRIRGTITPGTKTFATVIATLPSGFIPSTMSNMVGYLNIGRVLTGFTVGVDGTIKIYPPADQDTFTAPVTFNTVIPLD